MNLPAATTRLIEAVLDANQDAIIVTQSGSPINMQPWVSRTTTQVHMWVSKSHLITSIHNVLAQLADVSFTCGAVWRK